MAPSKTAFKKGQRVEVYHDPLGGTDKEGDATLRRFKYGGGMYFDRRIEWWEVRFANGQLAVRKLVEPPKGT